MPEGPRFWASPCASAVEEASKSGTLHAPAAIVALTPMTTILFVGSAVLAFVLAAAITPLVARLAERLGLMDVPGGRRNHPRPIARPGGLAIALAFGLTILLLDRKSTRLNSSHMSI